MDCLARIANMLDPEQAVSDEDVVALRSCRNPRLIALLNYAAGSEDLRVSRRVRELLTSAFYLHLLELMISTTDCDDAIPRLLHVMTEPKRYARMISSEGGQQAAADDFFPTGDAADHLFTLLYRDCPGITNIAAQALSLIDDACIIERLRQRLADGNSPHQAKTALALAWRSDPHAFPVLLDALSNGNWLVRLLGCNGLQVLADPRAIAQLSQVALADDESMVRDAAVGALGRIGGIAVIEPLISALHDTDEDVRRTSVSQLGMLQYPQATEPIVSMLRAEPDASVRCYAIYALEQMEDGVEAAVAALQDDSPEVRAAAAGALQQYEDPSTFSALIKALDDPDAHVRYAAADTLSEINSFHPDDPDVSETIRRLLRECYGDHE